METFSILMGSTDGCGNFLTIEIPPWSLRFRVDFGFRFAWFKESFVGISNCVEYILIGHFFPVLVGSIVAMFVHMLSSSFYFWVSLRVSLCDQDDREPGDHLPMKGAF